jgi:FtsP/CotA-like multicopper oxidase with cupredoxin domain
MGMGMGSFLINGRAFESGRVDERVRAGDLEIWQVVNASTEIHPFHAHAVSFQVLQRRGAGAIGPQDLGLKDTVAVWPGETVSEAERIGPNAGSFVLHCHNLEHEDGGMMATFAVS